MKKITFQSSPRQTITLDNKEAKAALEKLNRGVFRLSMSLNNRITTTEEHFPVIFATLYGIVFILLIVLYNW